MEDEHGLPAVLGGKPIRKPGTFRTTPELGEIEAEYQRAWSEKVATEHDPETAAYGLPLAEGAVIDQAMAELLGGEPAAFAAEFAELQAPGTGLGVVPASNGTRIITAGLAALTKVAPDLGLRIPQVGDEVIVPALTWQGTAGAVLRRNLVPVLVDVDPETLCLDPAAVEAAVTERTVGILPVHLYGCMADVFAINEIAKPLGAAVGEDCAHAHGARLVADGLTSVDRYAGAMGDFGTFSYQDSKTLTASEGGSGTSRHRRLFEQMVSVVTCGRRMGKSARLQAENERMPKLVAAFLRGQMRRFPEQTRLRAVTFAELDKVAEQLPGVRPLATQPHVEVPPTYKWAFFVDLDKFGGMSLDQLAKALSADLRCEVSRLYEPLNASSLYDPHSDPALSIDTDDFWLRIDPARYEAPVAAKAYRTALGLEHAVGLDEQMPEAFRQAILREQRYAKRIARDVLV